MLTPLVGRTILDETRIAGLVHVRLEYQPQDAPRSRRLRPPVDMLVIDALERPTAD